jgi:hypothetical protein
MTLQPASAIDRRVRLANVEYSGRIAHAADVLYAMVHYQPVQRHTPAQPVPVPAAPPRVYLDEQLTGYPSSPSRRTGEVRLTDQPTRHALPTPAQLAEALA